MAANFKLDETTALITGASAGLGAEFARQLASKARTLILVARRESALAAVRDSLKQAYPNLNVVICVADLANHSDRTAILDLIIDQRLPVNLLINNAGLGDYGPFATAEAPRIQTQIDVNITALVQLTHALLPTLRANKPAAVLNVSSLAGTLPLPGMSVYAATKAFVTSFSESLRIELQHEQINVAAVCPGPTPTTFSKTAHRADGTDADRTGQSLLRMPPEVVVAQGLAAIVHNSPSVYPGWNVATAARLFRLVPRALLRFMLSRRYRAASSTPTNSPPR